MRLVLIGMLTVTIAGAVSAAAFAHEGKLPEDALTLVQQASALLAQNPGMTGEVRERLEAALKSKKPQGVHLDRVALAVQALQRKDIATARRLLLEAIMPAGMPMPAQGRGPQPSAAAPPPAQPSPPSSVEVAMKMTEPLQVQFGRSKAEDVVLAFSLALMGFGLTALWRGREAVRP